MGVPSLNDLAVDGTQNTTNQPTLQSVIGINLKVLHFLLFLQLVDIFRNI